MDAPLRWVRRGALTAGLGLGLVACGEPAPVLEAPGETTLRRLTSDQYEQAIRDLFGDDLFVPADLEPDVRIQGLLAIGAAVTPISPRGIERFEEAAYIVAEQVLDEAHRGAHVTCSPSGPADRDCARQALEVLGPKIWRRPLTEPEYDTLLEIFDASAAALEDFWAALEFPLAMLLQSPDFLMRPEFGEPDPEGGRRFTGYEMASRLSFLFWNTVPDDELLAAAGRGELVTSDGIDAQAQRLWASPRAKDGVRAWASDMLHLDELDDLRKDPTVFVHMDDTVGASAREETLRGIEHLVFDSDSDFRALLTTRRTFVDRTLSAIYDIRAPERDGFGEAMLPADSPRRGLLGQVSFLALNAHPVLSSPTLRGAFIRESLLCQVLPDPPAGVDTSIPEVTGDTPTLRERVEFHLEQPGCSGCHQATDLIGLGLENFDGLGVYRTLDNGAPIDASGSLDGVEFTDAAGLAEALHDHPRLAPCMVKQVMRYGLGRGETDEEDDVLEWMSQQFAERDYRMQPLWLDVAISEPFRKVAEVTP